MFRVIKKKKKFRGDLREGSRDPQFRVQGFGFRQRVYRLGCRVPLLREEGTTSNVLRTLTFKIRPEYGLDCLICATFDRQRPDSCLGFLVKVL